MKSSKAFIGIGMAIGALTIFIMTQVNIPTLGQVGVGEDLDFPCDQIGGQCCPGDVISIANCNDGDICTADYCVLQGMDGVCINIPIPNPGCGEADGGADAGDGGANAGNGPGGDNGANAGDNGGGSSAGGSRAFSQGG